MENLVVSEIAPPRAAASPTRPPSIDTRVILAFFAIYVLWGSTFLFIRIAVLLIPPWFAAGCRFFIAGVILFSFMRMKGRPHPTLLEWCNLALIALLMFVLTYGALFWAEQFVPSGIASVLEATLPIITIAIEVFLLRKQPFRWKMLIGVALGFGGVLLLMMQKGLTSAPGAHGIFPSLVILGGSTAWSLGAVLTRSLALPKSRGINAGAEMMLGGAVLLALSAASGELHPFPHIPGKAVFALAYLIIAGSLIAYSSFVWLLARMPATVVSSHAYVNPLVAVALGYFVLREPITVPTLGGTILVVASVALLLKRKGPPPVSEPT